MLRIALLDDEKAALLISKGAIESFFEDKGIAFKLDVFSSPETFLANAKEEVYQLLLLDIDMPSKNGISVAKEVKQISFETTIIFLSRREDLVFECLSLHPFGFIRKSKIMEDFSKVLELYLSTTYAELEKPALFSIKNKTSVISMKIADIVYAEGNRNYQTIHFKNKTTQNIRISMNDLYEALSPKGFIRIQKGFLANYIYIRRIDGNGVTLIDGNVLPISLKRKDEIMEEYLKITRNSQSLYFE